ncbi:unnamed protein product [Pleuronectes platessa]|uniref:Uncharacterized protein n=1 Tax=Pleuronectes platessa TaxID=8262 RepID=A0A9N7U360_PLEPL|nr:unnamed protein product [Pleuronectes platessa]
MDDRDSDTLNSDEEKSDEENSDEENSDEENSEEENSDEENSEEENSDEENSEEENSDEENSDEENSDEENSGDESSHDGGGDGEKCRLCKTSDKPRHPCEPTRMSTPNLAHVQLDLVITGLVMYTIKKAKVPPSVIDAHSLIKHLSEKAKQQIKHDEMFVTTFQNVEKIHKAVFKEVLKKLGTAKEVLQFMERQRVDSIFIDELRIQLMSPPPKKKGCFGRFVSSMGKLFRGRKAVYEQSCEAYKHNGNTSGHFHIDVDGSGPIRPQLVYCNMTEDDTWMVIHHNNSELTRVRPSPDVNQLLVHFDYSSREEQLSAVISQSQHCEQELAYRCRKSRLLNTPEGSPFSWWLGGPGPGHLQAYWGGAQPGSQQCACGLQGDCVDPQHYCNCDADRLEWAEDSGLLTHKESLPVRSLVLGDLQRPGSEAAYRVGPLRCKGDKSFWNAAFFDKETSYLHFPTFHGELSADISFLFKTTASSGVFLENLGIRDFIRIELRSSTQVVFSFDVGNGPLEVLVQSNESLNDSRWHRVRAERNVKEATLRLDQLPPARQEAPAEGHVHLQLNSQLFIALSDIKAAESARPDFSINSRSSDPSPSRLGGPTSSHNPARKKRHILKLL